jgi:integrase
MGSRTRLSAPEKADAERVLGAGKDANFGGGLWLRTPRGLARSLYWSFRYTSPAGVRRDMSLGTVLRSSPAQAAESLSRARAEVARNRDLLRQAIDPIDFKNAEKERTRSALHVRQAEAKREARTLARVAREYYERVIEPNRSDKHARQGLQSLETHVPAGIWHAPIATLDAPAMLPFLEKLQQQIPETARRIRQRLDAVFEDAIFHRLATGNPAASLKRKLREAMKGKKRQRGHFAALPYAQAPGFMAKLRAREGIAARALEFAVLTAARTGEVLGATWEEFDLTARTWTVPGERMKGSETHTVYLAPRAVEIVESMRELAMPYVFPAPSLTRESLSNMALLTVLRRMDADKATTVHGLARSTFSTWANETGTARPEVIEVCLAHREANLVRSAYNRASFAAERAALLRAWADFLAGTKPAAGTEDADKVIAFPGVQQAA